MEKQNGQVNVRELGMNIARLHVYPPRDQELAFLFGMWFPLDFMREIILLESLSHLGYNEIRCK